MRTADDAKHVIIKGLGIDADTVNTVSGGNSHLALGNGVGSACLQGIFFHGGNVDILLNDRKQPFKLGLVKDSGRSAAYVNGLNSKTKLLYKVKILLDLSTECYQIVGNGSKQLFRSI